MLMMSPLNSIEPKRSSLKGESVLVFLKDQDNSLNSAYLVAFLFLSLSLSLSLSLNFSIIEWNVNFHTIFLFKQWSVLELQVCRYWLNIGQG